MPTTPPPRIQALRMAVAALRERYGPRIIRSAADLAVLDPLPGASPLSTGSLGLDLLTGGIPRGLTEYAGLDGAGKTTLALRALAICQQGGGLAMLVDADGAADPDALDAVGVDLARLVLACPTTRREGWDVLHTLCRCGALDLLVLASLPGLLSLPHTAGAVDSPVRGLMRLQTALRGRATSVLLTNRPLDADARLAVRLGFMTEPDRPMAWTTMGGVALAQVATLRIGLERAGLIYTTHGEVAALRVVAHVVKHHGFPRGPALPLEIAAHGPRRSAELVALGRLTGAVWEDRLGLTTALGPLGRTVERAAQCLDADAALADALEQQIRAAWRVSGTGPTGAGAAR